jgi:hypothetical protein
MCLKFEGVCNFMHTCNFMHICTNKTAILCTPVLELNEPMLYLRK